MTDETPALSPSIAHTLLMESPLHAWTEHRLLGNVRKPPTDPQLRGNLIHALILEDGDGIDVHDFRDWRTNAAQAARDESLAQGRTPILAAKMVEYRKSADSILLALTSRGFEPRGGECEKRLSWSDGAGGDVLCSGRADWVRDDLTLIGDLKTTEGSVSLDACTMKLLKSPAVIQDAAYRRAIELTHPELAGRVNVVFWFAQTVEPYAVTAVECAGSMREIGEARWARALDVWSRCLAKGTHREHWPPAATGIELVHAPPWAIAREYEEEAA